jgi:DNA polymerase III subunit delta'
LVASSVMVDRKGDDPQRSGAAPDRGYLDRYPWHIPLWGIVTRDLARLPHGLLLHGPAGLGKTSFAWRLAHTLLCGDLKSVADGACLTCNSCALFAAGTHPDLLSVAPVEDATGIAIDQVREVREFLALKPHTSAYKIVILNPAEAMNVNAANALLKVLEEPPPGSLLVLVSAIPSRLPATIRSRTTSVAFRTPSESDGLAWLTGKGVDNERAKAHLAQAGGAPVRALEYATASTAPDPQQLLNDLEALRSGKEDPTRCASRWKSTGSDYCLAWFQRYLAALIRKQAMDGTFPFSIKDLYTYFDFISDIRNQLSGPLDETLLLEDALVGWCRISRRLG